MNQLSFDRSCKSFLRGFGGGADRMVVSVGLDHRCHAKQDALILWLRTTQRVASAPGRNHFIALIRYLGSETLDHWAPVGYER